MDVVNDAVLVICRPYPKSPRLLIFSSQSTEPSLMGDVNVLCITNDLYTIFMTETCQNLPQGFKLIHLFYL